VVGWYANSLPLKEYPLVRIFSSTEAAADLGIDPRALRRWLRDNPSYQNAGLGGRYMFQDSDLTSIRHQMKRDGVRVKGFVPLKQQELLNDDEGLALDRLLAAQGNRAALAALRIERREARAARQQRLRVRIDEVLPTRYDDEEIYEYFARVGWSD
jgi:hypothetical protein